MNIKKTNVFLTGATGVMGMAGLREFMNRPEDYSVTVLARNTKKNHQKLRTFIDKGVRVIWGDLLDETSLKKGIENADIVLHVGGMVSPMAEHFPEKTLKVNVGSMKSIIRLVEDLENQDPSTAIKVVYIGSVSQYESRIPPNHWGKVGDPLKGAKFDAYAESKIKAEEALVNSNLKKWVSLRQTAILHPGLLMKANDPVTFHVPLQGVIEWITTEDSGRLLERVSRKDVPDDFWGKCYNVGGGEPFRLTNLEFERGILKALGCPPPEKIFEPNWFATQNFHGMWFEDSDDLDKILHFRNPDSFEEALNRLKKQIPWYFKLAPLAPAFIIKVFMKKVAAHPELGPLSWIKTNDLERISAAWGSLEAYRKIPSWSQLKPLTLSKSTPS
ncbi:MAG: NAD(P)-dependent oxidoreductase [Muribaculaceae bacterium]|nr:NAD(P)-dependent oxidoreductase [Muribaculaceae bacterium]